MDAWMARPRSLMVVASVFSALLMSCVATPQPAAPPTSTAEVAPQTSRPQTTTSDATLGLVGWKSIPAPAGAESAREWLELETATARGLRQAPVAVFRPAGEGPFPVLVYLHGDSGLASPMLAWAPRLADAGFITLAGAYRPAPVAPERIACPNCPLAQEGTSALVELAQRVPGARADALGILGLSSGASEALRAGKRSDVRAVVADGGSPVAEDPLRVRAAVLLLGFTEEPAMPGLQFFDRTLRAAGRPVESHFYEGPRHVATLDSEVGPDATARTLDFFRRHLR